MRAGRCAVALATVACLVGCGGGGDDDASADAVDASSALALSASGPVGGSPDQVVATGRAACASGARFFVNRQELPAVSGAASSSSSSSVAAPPRALRVSSDACNRPVPYDTFFSLTADGFAPEAVTGVEVDFDGDGIVDYKGKALTDRLSHTYAKAGVFRARFTVTLADGTRLDTVRPQAAITLADATAPLSSALAGLSSAFKLQDIDKALTFFTADAQSRHGWALSALRAQLPGLAASMANARPAMVGDEHAQYEIPVTVGADTVVYNLTFVKDESGAWKIDSL